MLELVTAPAAEVVSTADLKTWLRVDHSSDDTLIESLGKAARLQAENYTSRKFITQTWRLWLDGWPRDPDREPWWDGVVEAPITVLDRGFKTAIDLKLAPVSSVSSVKYYGTDDTEYTLSTDDWMADLIGAPGRVKLKYSKLWPSTTLRPAKGVAVQFVVGYGAAGSSVPETIVTAIKEITLSMYENRGSCECPMPGSAKALLDEHVIKRV